MTNWPGGPLVGSDCEIPRERQERPTTNSIVAAVALQIQISKSWSGIREEEDGRRRRGGGAPFFCSFAPFASASTPATPSKSRREISARFLWFSLDSKQLAKFNYSFLRKNQMILRLSVFTDTFMVSLVVSLRCNL